MFTISTFSTQADSKIHRYQNKVKSICEDKHLNNLLLKKSLIELVKGMECRGKFTQIVINKCQELSCKKLGRIYKNLEQQRAGSIVGGE